MMINSVLELAFCSKAFVQCEDLWNPYRDTCCRDYLIMISVQDAQWIEKELVEKYQALQEKVVTLQVLVHVYVVCVCRVCVCVCVCVCVRVCVCVLYTSDVYMYVCMCVYSVFMYNVEIYLYILEIVMLTFLVISSFLRSQVKLMLSGIGSGN